MPKGKKKIADKGTGSLVQRKPGGKWHAQWINSSGKRKSRALHFNKTVAREMLNHLLDRTAKVKVGMLTERESKIKDADARPVLDHVVDYETHLTDNHRTAKHAFLCRRRVEKLVGFMGAERLSDITRDKVVAALARYRQSESANRHRPIGQQTSNHALAAMKAFLNWCVRGDRVADNVLKGHAKIRVTQEEHARATFSEEQVAALLRVAGDSRRLRPRDRRPGLYGLDRRWFYELAVETGLRREEVASLTPESFHLDDAQPFVRVAGAKTKNRRAVDQPFRGGLVPRLRAFLADKPPVRPVFTPPRGGTFSRMFHADLRAAGIPRVEHGEHRDYHSLRHTYCLRLKKAGVSFFDAVELMRHSDPKLTAKIYGRLGIRDLSAAVGRLDPGEARGEHRHQA